MLSGDRLRTIIVSGSWPPEIIEARRMEFITSLLKTCGDPSEAAIQILQREEVFYHIPVILWKSKRVIVVVSYSPSQDPQGQPYNQSGGRFAPYFFEIKVSDDQEDLQRFMKLLPASEIESSEYKYLFADIVGAGMKLPLLRK